MKKFLYSLNVLLGLSFCTISCAQKNNHLKEGKVITIDKGTIIRATSDSTFNVCFNTEDKKEILKIIKKYDLPAANVFQEAQYAKYIEKNLKKAFTLYNIAADMGSLEAMHDLADLHYRGEGTPVNHELAAKFIKKPAEAGFQLSVEFYAMMHYYGHGVKRDLDKAYELFQPGIKEGDTEALLYGGLCLMNREKVDKTTINTVIDLWTKAAEKGESTAAANLGLIYYDGEYVEKDYATAMKWFELSASKDNIIGLFQLGTCYFYARGTERDLEKAKTYYLRAAEKGNAMSAYNIGMIYQEQNDVTNTIKWMRQAAQMGFEPAKDFLQKNGLK